MLDFLGSVGLFLNPRAHGTENSGENTAPAEPEQDELRSMAVSHRRGKTSHAEDHTDSQSEAVGKGDRSTVRGSEPHIVPGDPYIYEDTDDGKKCQKQCLSAVSASGRAAEIFPRDEKQDK